MGALKIVPTNDSDRNEFLRINRGGRKMHKITGQIQRVIYRDKDTRQIVVYFPSLELTGYGINEEKAMEMIKFSMNQLFMFFLSLSQKKLDEELSKFGWKHINLKNKEYSKAYIDISGKLKNFNAVADEVKIELLTV